jgi:hypothetical protein
MTSSAEIPRCVSCGAPLVRERADLAKATVGDRCAGCVRPDGSFKPRDEITRELADFLVRSLDLSKRAARQVAEERVAGLPAWRKS